PTVVEDELDGRVLAFALGKVAGVDQQRAGEPRLNDEPVAAREIEHDKLRASPRPGDLGADHSLGQRARADLTEDVGAADANGDDSSSCDLAIEVAGDGLGFR